MLVSSLTTTEIGTLTTHDLQGPQQRVSADPDVHIFSRSLILGLSRFTIAIIMILVLFAPIPLLLSVDSTQKRLGVTFACAVAFVAVLSVLLRTTALELFVAGAT